MARRCWKGDDEAMRQVFEEHEPRLRALAYRLTGSAEDAEEIAVSTFINFWRSPNCYRGESTLRAFLNRVCLNLSRDRLRRTKVFLRLLKQAPLPAAETTEDWKLSVEYVLPRMRAEDREILALYYLEDSTYEEIGESLGITYEVLRTRLVRARKRLRKELGVNDDE